MYQKWFLSKLVQIGSKENNIFMNISKISFMGTYNTNTNPEPPQKRGELNTEMIEIINRHHDEVMRDRFEKAKQNKHNSIKAPQINKKVLKHFMRLELGALALASAIGAIALKPTKSDREIVELDTAKAQQENLELELVENDIEPSYSYEIVSEDDEKIVFAEIKEPQTIEDRIYDCAAFDFTLTLSDRQRSDIEAFIKNYEENYDRYKYVSDVTGVPASLVAAIHYRECTSDFDRCQHNGAKLGTEIQVAENEYKTFSTWEESAIDAMTRAINGKGLTIIEGDFHSYCEFAECYNGTGYRDWHNMNSPYVWAGTDKYTTGKYVSDGSFKANVVDDQVGVAVLLMMVDYFD